MIKQFTYATLALCLLAGPAIAQEDSSTLTAKKAEPVAKATPVAKSSSKSSDKTIKAVPQARPLVVTVDLLNSTKISGTLTDKTNLEMQTSFGPAEIPLSEVAGVRFASADDPSTTIVMLNGDSITGATDVQMVTVETEWGVATINGSSVRSILFVPDVTWNPLSGLSGQRWSLTNVKKEQEKQKAAQQAAAQRAAQQQQQQQQQQQNYGRGRVIYRGR